MTLSFVTDPELLSRLASAYAYIQDDLLRNRKYLWEKMQQKAANLIEQGEQCLALQPGDITRLMVWTDAFIQMGEDFSGSYSSELRTAVKLRVTQYFDRLQSQHWSSLLYFPLSTYLESEQWTRLPVPRNFDIEKIVHSGLKSHKKLLSALVSGHFASSFSALVLSRPFEEDDTEEDTPLTLTASTGLYEESPVLCTSAYQLLKSLVSLSGFTRTFTPISFDIFLSITRLIDLFVYVIYSRFVLKSDRDRLNQHIEYENPGLPSLEKAYDLHLFHTDFHSIRINIIRIKDLLDSKISPKSWVFEEAKNSPSVTESVIAINSCKLVVTTMEFLKEGVTEALQPDCRDFMEKYYVEMMNSVKELDMLVAKAVSYKLNKGEWLVKTISEKPWDSHTGAPSSYVDIILQYIEDVRERLASSPLPAKLKFEVLNNSVQHCSDQMVEGFSKVRVSSIAGRQQMMTDLREFASAVELYGVKLEGVGEQLEYLQVWNQPAGQVLEWCLQHPKIPLRQLRGLLETNKDLQNQPTASRSTILGRFEVTSNQIEFRRYLKESEG